ncbi:capreomycidine synthase [Amycolatopsis vastitatis]|uniref:Capreomycidine synthase n=1 Tax=Amycolatopsis vastitatis TaxID=1905142 RepID=A0A229SKA0_9PSEU|nr:capreomycidine synthase [Amycolatopsis vastitatis]OXM59362.1 capreomycidine synthase [Amycolatopsis vastitatis]
MFKDVSSAALEFWLRDRYFGATIDISSSGTPPFRLDELRTLLGIESAELDQLGFEDSPSTGSDRLRSAISRRYSIGDSHKIMVTHGSSEALFLAISALITPGDEIVVMEPAYSSLISIARALGAIVHPWRLDYSGDGADLAGLEKIVSGHTRAIIVNFPHNPTGQSLQLEQFLHLMNFVNKSGCYLLWDGAFSELVHDSAPLPDPTNHVERSMSFGTLSKSYGLPGLRIGWCIAEAPIIDDMVRLRDYVTLSCSPIAEHLASRVLEHGDVVVRDRVANAQRNRSTLLEWAAGNAHSVQLELGSGGVTIFPEIDVPDTRAMCEELYDRHRVLVVPGDCFGAGNRVRIGYGGSTEELKRGLGHISDHLRQRRR